MLASDGPATGRPSSAADLLASVCAEVVGRERQIIAALAVLEAGRDLLLEGPPGTSKSTILRSITRHHRIPLVFVEGNADLTPAKLIGHHDPAQVLHDGYRAENFVDGPLPDAMRRGGFLYIEEFNRAPEDTLNTLLTAMAERELTIPRVGRVLSAPSFRLVAAMNPFDNVGTSRVSASIYDRLCRLAIDYQSEAEERRIVSLRTGVGPGRLVEFAVAAARATREHPELRAGSSVRGAIDFVLVAQQLAELRGRPDASDRDVLRVAAPLALSSKIIVDEASGATPEHVILELVETLL